MPEDTQANEAASSRTTNQKTQKTIKLYKNAGELHRREKNKSAEKLKKTTGGVDGNNLINVSRSKGSNARA